jgi:hypothetical protein
MLADQKSCTYSFCVTLYMDCNSHTFSSRLRLKCDGTRAETRFHLSAKRTSPFKLAGVSVQSTTGSRGVHISGSNVGHNMFRGSVKGTGYPLHSPVSPSLPIPCVIVCHHVSTGLHLLPTQPPSCLHKYWQHKFPGGNWPISDFGLPLQADENCALLGYYAVSGVNFLLTFRDKLSVPSSRVKMIGCPKMSVGNYHYSLRKNPKEHSSQLTHCYTALTWLCTCFPTRPSPSVLRGSNNAQYKFHSFKRFLWAGHLYELGGFEWKQRWPTLTGFTVIRGRIRK